MMQRFRVDDPRQFAVDVIENVGDGIFCEAFEAGISRPTEMRSEHDVSEFQQRVIRRHWFFNEDVERGTGDRAFFNALTRACSSTIAPRAVLTR